MVSNVLIFTPIWGWFPFWRAYFSNELKPPHRWDFNKTIIRIPMFHNQFLKANFCPQQTRVTKKWSRWRLVCLRLSPSATATWNLAYNRMSCIQPVAFFGVGKKKRHLVADFQFPRKNHPRFTLRYFFSCYVCSMCFSQNKFGWSTSSFTRRLDRSMSVGEASSGVMVMLIRSFHSPFDDFGGLLGPGGLNLRPKRNTVHRNEGSTCVGLVAGTWWPVYLF